jgi:hypothetical protein
MVRARVRSRLEILQMLSGNLLQFSDYTRNKNNNT